MPITGSNFSLRQIFPETLFIGLGMSHPAAQTGYERARETLPAVPSVTGYAANFKKVGVKREDFNRVAE